MLTVGADFTVGGGMGVEGAAGDHPVHGTVAKTQWHLSVLQRECVLEVRTPRAELPHGRCA